METFYKEFELKKDDPIKLIELLQKVASLVPFEESPEEILFFLMADTNSAENVVHWKQQCLLKIKQSPAFSSFKKKMAPIYQKSQKKLALDEDECDFLLRFRTTKFEKILGFTLEHTDEPHLKKKLLLQLNKRFPSDKLIFRTACVLKSNDNELVHEALAALKLNGSPKILPYILDVACQHPSLPIQEYAVEIITSFSTTIFEKVLESMLYSSKIEYQQSAFNWIRKKGVALFVPLIKDLLQKEKHIAEILPLLSDCQEISFIEPLEQLKATHPEFLDDIVMILKIMQISEEVTPPAEEVIELEENFEEIPVVEEAREEPQAEITEETEISDESEGESEGGETSIKDGLTKTLTSSFGKIVKMAQDQKILEKGKGLIGSLEEATKRSEAGVIDEKKATIQNEKINPLLKKVALEIFNRYQHNPGSSDFPSLIFSIMEKRKNLKDAKERFKKASEKSSGGFFSNLLGMSSEDKRKSTAEEKNIQRLEEQLEKTFTELGRKVYQKLNEKEFSQLQLAKEWKQLTTQFGEIEELELQLKKKDEKEEEVGEE
ncbi:hypothetical protein ACFL35_07095 [Candidatus Riflebacteria bacterium]